MPIFLEYLRGCIDWNSYGFEICCEAHDGQEALDKMSEYLPDVVLTDITMPYLNGLELSEKIVKDYPDTAVVLITGNNEFEYARKAVKIGVCDYIVKPFEKEELILSLLKLKDNIDKAVESSDLVDDPRTSDDLKSLIYAGVSDDEQGKAVENKLFSSRSDKAGFLLGVIKMDVEETEGGKWETINSHENLMNWESLIAKMLRDKIDIEGELKIFHDYENNIVTIMRFNDIAELESYKGYEFSDIITIVKNQLDYDVSISLAKADKISDIKKAYDKALFNVSLKGKGQFNDLREVPDIKIESSLDGIYRLNKDIETLQEDDARDAINLLWERLHDMNSDSDVKPSISEMNMITSAISILLTNIINSGFSVEKIFGDGFSPETFFKDAKSSFDMKEKVIELYQKRIAFEKEKTSSKSRDIALKAKDYIEKNYSDFDISISDISESLCVNQTYLRKMFKSEMNMTLSEYITQYRMQEAKKLITTTDEKLVTIAEKVGYSDVSYFSNVFKKFYGISPRSIGKE